MMKSYLRYEPGKVTGIITSPSSNVVYDCSGNLAVTAGVQDVNIWNLRQGQQIASLKAEESGYPYTTSGEVRSLATSPDQSSVAAGYSSGDIRIFDFIKQTVVTTLRGHRSEVLCLFYETPASSSSSSSSSTTSSSTYLLSGGADTDIYIWDTVSFTGLCCLRGHKGPITQLLCFTRAQQRLVVSASKDTLLKVWDVDTRTCIQTIVGHRSEIWSMVRYRDRIVTGSGDEWLRFYRLNATGGEGAGVLLDDSETVLELYGTVLRGRRDGTQAAGKSKCMLLCVNAAANVLACVGDNKVVDFFKLRSAEEVAKKLKRRQKRLREKTGKGKGAWEGGGDEGGEDEAEDVEEDEREVEDEGGDDSSGVAALTDELEHMCSHRCSSKIRGFAFSPIPPKATSRTVQVGSIRDKFLLSTAENSLEMYGLEFNAGVEKDKVVTKASVLDLHGHRSDVRACSVSDDGLTLVSASSEGVKTWSTSSHQCLHSAAVGYAICVAFIPGGRYVAAGTKLGEVKIVDTTTGTVTSVDDAHEGPIWSMAVRPDGAAFMTGGADKMVRFWDLTAAADKGGVVACVLNRQLQMTHDVLCVAYSSSRKADALMIAIGQLDCTTKLFYDDSLKFFLSLYGHKLPVMCVDVSYDSKICVTGSADKTIKIWGLDFGDCHRSLIGHTDSVTCIKFQPQTHYFFSGGKDGVVKYWDADRFEQVLSLPGHKGAVWGLDISPDASFCVSTGQDRSIRFWVRGEDLVFVEEEKERYLEALADRATEGQDDDNQALAVGRRGVESVKGGEMLMDALDLVEAELTEDEAHAAAHRGRPGAKRKPNPVLLNMTPHEYFLSRLRLVKQADLEQALLVLPFHYVSRLVSVLLAVIKTGGDYELPTRCAVFLVRCHFSAIVSTQSLVPEMAELMAVLRGAVSEVREVMGGNIAALRYMQRMAKERERIFVDDTPAPPLTSSVGRKGKSKNKRLKTV